MQIIMGLDPGSRYLGFGVLGKQQEGITHIDHGIIHLNSSLSFSKRLLKASEMLESLFLQYNPHELSIENIFLGKNPQSIFKLGHLRGVCLAQGEKAQCEIFEYAPRKIKKLITGNGAATKEHVRLISLSQLGIESHLGIDATDALSLALGHIYATGTELKMTNPYNQNIKEGLL